MIDMGEVRTVIDARTGCVVCFVPVEQQVRYLSPRLTARRSVVRPNEVVVESIAEFQPSALVLGSDERRSLQ